MARIVITSKESDIDKVILLKDKIDALIGESCLLVTGTKDLSLIDEALCIVVVYSNGFEDIEDPETNEVVFLALYAQNLHKRILIVQHDDTPETKLIHDFDIVYHANISLENAITDLAYHIKKLLLTEDNSYDTLVAQREDADGCNNDFYGDTHLEYNDNADEFDLESCDDINVPDTRGYYHCTTELNACPDEFLSDEIQSTDASLVTFSPQCSEIHHDIKPNHASPCEAADSGIGRQVINQLLRKILSWSSSFRKKTDNVFASIFAPAEIKPLSHMLVQLYLHLPNETEVVKSLAKEAQKDAERRGYIPLEWNLNHGDRVDIQLTIRGDKLLFSDTKNIIWRGAFTKCSFDYFVPGDINVNELCCNALLTTNGIPIGEMTFITEITSTPRQVYTEIVSHKFSNIFISYAHQDEAKVKFLAEGFRISGKNYFFDRHYLKAGDIYPQKIQEFISIADLFILCWSRNAMQSEYVQKELAQALSRAYPIESSKGSANLFIYPISISPKAELPENMREVYNFIEL